MTIWKSLSRRGTELPKIGMAQLSVSQSMEENLGKSLSAIKEAAAKRSDLIIFPEIQLCPFFPQYKNSNAKPYCLKLDSPEVQSLQDACKKSNINAIPNIYLSEGRNAFNASIMIDRSGQILGVSKMVHITQTPGFYEQTYYTPSTEGFKVFETDIGRIGIVICFDRHFPESFRDCVVQGADLIIVPTVNMLGEPMEMFDWEIRVAAFQNSVAIGMCNRVGQEGDATYYGRSILAGPSGEIIMQADNTEKIFFAEFKLSGIRTARQKNNYLELYDPSVFSLDPQLEHP